MSPLARYLVGLVLPFLAVIPTVPLLNRLPVTLLGMPLGLMWLFACIPLTTLCLAICWLRHDRYLPEEQIEADYEGHTDP